MKFDFKAKAEKQFKKIDFQNRIRILEKLKFYSCQENPLRFAESLSDFQYGNWRFRVGEYRILFDIRRDTIVILKVGHRKDIYK